MDMAGRVKAQRERLGLTRQDVLERLKRLGVKPNPGWLRQVETGGLSGAPSRKLLGLAQTLGVTLEWLLTGKGRR